MKEIRYSPHPAGFYTFTFDGAVTGLGCGPAVGVQGLFNLAWLTLPDFDKYEVTPRNEVELGTWTDRFAAPFVATCRSQLSGVQIGRLATMLTAKGLLAYLKIHPDFKDTAGYAEFGPRWIAYMEQRAAKSVDLVVDGRTNGRLPRMESPYGLDLKTPKVDLTPQNLVKGNVIDFSTWMSKLKGEAA